MQIIPRLSMAQNPQIQDHRHVGGWRNPRHMDMVYWLLTPTKGKITPSLGASPATDVNVLDRVLDSPIMPLAAYRADRLCRIHPKERRRNGSSHIALWPPQCFSRWHGRLSESERECDAVSLVELGRFKQDLEQNLIG